MWSLFLAVYLVCLLLLYVPGILFFRFCGCSGIKAVVVAPIFTLFVFGITGILFQKMGVSCPWHALPLVALCASLLGLLVRFILKKSVAELRVQGNTTWSVLVAYLVVGVAITVNMFVAPLDGPE